MPRRPDLLPRVGGEARRVWVPVFGGVCRSVTRFGRERGARPRAGCQTTLPRSHRESTAGVALGFGNECRLRSSSWLSGGRSVAVARGDVPRAARGGEPSRHGNGPLCPALLTRSGCPQGASSDGVPGNDGVRRDGSDDGDVLVDAHRRVRWWRPGHPRHSRRGIRSCVDAHRHQLVPGVAQAAAQTAVLDRSVEVVTS